MQVRPLLDAAVPLQERQLLRPGQAVPHLAVPSDGPVRQLHPLPGQPGPPVARKQAGQVRIQHAAIRSLLAVSLYVRNQPLRQGLF